VAGLTVILTVAVTAFGAPVRALQVVSSATPLGAAVQAMQDSMQGQFPPAAPLLVMAAYTAAFGFLAKRFFRWE
jgi:ABC-2 type transport system permease protein